MFRTTHHALFCNLFANTDQTNKKIDILKNKFEEIQNKKSEYQDFLMNNIENEGASFALTALTLLEAKLFCELGEHALHLADQSDAGYHLEKAHKLFILSKEKFEQANETAPFMLLVSINKIEQQLKPVTILTSTDSDSMDIELDESEITEPETKRRFI